MRPIKIAPDDALHDQMVRSRRRTPARAEIDLPFRRNEKVHDRERLLLLMVYGDKISELAIVRVIFHTEVEILRRGVRERRGRSERHATGRDVTIVNLLLLGRRIGWWKDYGNLPDYRPAHPPITTPDCLIHERHDLPRPGRIRKCGPRISQFGR